MEKLKLIDLFFTSVEKKKHGLMIDAGSTGSRMHVYEFEKRVLEGRKEITEVVSVSTLLLYVVN